MSGDERAINDICKIASDRIRGYLNRCTLNEEIAADLTQEVLLKVIESLGKLKDQRRFWPWIFSIATNCLRSHFRDKRQSTINFSSLENNFSQNLSHDINESRESLEKHEVLKHILDGVNELSDIQKQVLSLRCYEDMSYNDISNTLGCSETTARVSMARAKRQLKRHIKTRGLAGTTSLGAALAIFGEFTAGSEAAAASIAVGAGSVSGVGATATLIAGLTSTIGKLLIAAAAIAAVFFGFNKFMEPASIPDREKINNIHYEIQGIYADDATQDMIRALQKSGRGVRGYPPGIPFKTKGAYEVKMFFPEGPDGPMLCHQQRWTIDHKGKLCSWLQDGSGNYYYNGGLNTIYSTNDPIGFEFLPVDEPQLREQIISMGMQDDRMKYECCKKTGLVKKSIDGRVSEVGDFESEYEYNTLSFEDVISSWPKDAKIVDQRDEMHKRGWTYFKIVGDSDGSKISGYGCIPFTYNAWKERKPWLVVDFYGIAKIIDTDEGAELVDLAGNVLKRYPAGTFFEGLSRPWSGIRTYGTVCRDGAKYLARYSRKRYNETGLITIKTEIGEADFSVDMAKDIIQTICVRHKESNLSLTNLSFEFLQNIDGVENEFQKPNINVIKVRKPEELDNLWLFKLDEIVL